MIQLATFPDLTECFQCHKILRGKFFQGYRCLRCQAVLHKSCLADCPCLQVGTLKKTESLVLPIAESEQSFERSNSTLSLATDEFNGNSKRNSQIQQVVSEYQRGLSAELERLPLEEHSWYAGELSGKIGTDRLDGLPVGTFLVRRRANDSYALMLKTTEGVKSMKIEESSANPPQYSLSEARKFDSIQKLLAHYRDQDLTENFNYAFLRGVPLKTPFKDI